MPTTSRAALALVMGLVGLAVLAGQSRGQAGAAPNPSAPQAPAPAAATTALRIGAIDMDKVFEGYKKAAFIREQIKQEIVAKNGELNRLMNQMRQLAKELEGLEPNGHDYKAKEGEITKLKAQYEAEREQAQGEFARRDAEALATIYKDLQDMTARVARAKGLNFVVKVSNEPPTGSDPNSVMAAMSHSILYHDPALDVTNYVVYNLNLDYEKQAGAKGQPAAPADRSATPASATAAPAAAVPATAAPAATATAPGRGAPR